MDADRFWSLVDRSGGDDACWPWLAGKVPGGYGRAHIDGRPQGAHRVSYELLVGPIPEGLVLDHLCRRPACVNPKHLEPVTHGVNVTRGRRDRRAERMIRRAQEEKGQLFP